ncbi:prepilin-type N-terminal cleavage/methylation domain-containing protein, partial [bacterium]|nr:prepilin-type N-terminal cleavage/methylation domain-containing protein [bacterium]
MMFGTRRKGYTLIELLLAMALFVSLSGGLGYAIIKGVNAHAFESSYREATLQTRNVLDQMLEELRMASTPDEGHALGANQFGIPSSVWFPNAYGNTSTDFPGYELKKETRKLGDKTYSAHVGYNR